MESSDYHVLADCSDDEQYFDPKELYRKHPNNPQLRLWEPSGDDIYNLYEKIKQNEYLELEWKCSGRLSPSQFADDQETVDHTDESKQNDKNQTTQREQIETKTEFDFDNEFDDVSTFNDNANDNDNESNKKLSTNNRGCLLTKHSKTSTTSMMMKTKTTTNLTKVMQNIKKYQLNDH